MFKLVYLACRFFVHRGESVLSREPFRFFASFKLFRYLYGGHWCLLKTSDKQFWVPAFSCLSEVLNKTPYFRWYYKPDVYRKHESSCEEHNQNAYTLNKYNQFRAPNYMSDTEKLFNDIKPVHKIRNRDNDVACDPCSSYMKALED